MRPKVLPERVWGWLKTETSLGVSLGPVLIFVRFPCGRTGPVPEWVDVNLIYDSDPSGPKRHQDSVNVRDMKWLLDHTTVQGAHERDGS